MPDVLFPTVLDEGVMVACSSKALSKESGPLGEDPSALKNGVCDLITHAVVNTPLVLNQEIMTSVSEKDRRKVKLLASCFFALIHAMPLPLTSVMISLAVSPHQEGHPSVHLTLSGKRRLNLAARPELAVCFC